MQHKDTVGHILIPKQKLIFFTHFGIPDPLLCGSQRCLLNYTKKGRTATISFWWGKKWINETTTRPCLVRCGMGEDRVGAGTADYSVC